MPFSSAKVNANTNIYTNVDAMLTKLNNRYGNEHKASKVRAKFEKL